MPCHIYLEPHPTNDELEARYRGGRAPVERSHGRFSGPSPAYGGAA